MLMRARVIIRISGNAKLWCFYTVHSTSANSTELFLSSAHPGNCCLHVYVFTVEDTFFFFLFCQASIDFLIFHSFQHYCCEGGY